MIPIKQRLLKPLKYPEFTIPGMLALLIGAAFAIPAFTVGNVEHLGLIAALLVATGVGLLSRSIAGTALLVLSLALLLYYRIPRLEFTPWTKLVSLVLGLLWLASMISAVVVQIQFHRTRKHQTPIAER